MRFSLPILLLTATAALAQSQPAPADKPFVHDGPGLNSFTAPTPVTIGPGTAADAKATDKPGRIELRPTMPGPQKPEAPKPAPKGVA